MAFRSERKTIVDEEARVIVKNKREKVSGEWKPTYEPFNGLVLEPSEEIWGRFGPACRPST